VPAPGAAVDLFGDTAFNFMRRTPPVPPCSRPFPAGSFTAQAAHPDNGSLITQAAGALVNEGDNIVVVMTLPAAGTVSGRVTYGDGRLAPFADVEFIDPALGYATQSTSADSGGNYSFGGVAAGAPFTMRVTRFDGYSNYTGYPHRDVVGTPIGSDGQVETIDLTLPAIATVRVTAQRFDGSAFANARVDWMDSATPFFQFGGYADANGHVTIGNVHEGDVTVLVRDPNNVHGVAPGGGDGTSGRRWIDGGSVGASDDPERNGSWHGLRRRRNDAGDERLRVCYQRRGRLVPWRGRRRGRRYVSGADLRSRGGQGSR